MATFQYRWMDQPEPSVYISPCYYTDVAGIELVNCGGTGACKEQAWVVDVFPHDRALEYLYRCKRGHEFRILYHKEASAGRPKMPTRSFPASMILSAIQVVPLQTEDWRDHGDCVHCGRMAARLVQGYDRDSSTLHKVGVCEGEIVRYQPEKWREWVWEAEWGKFTFRGPCTAYHLAETGDSTLAIEEYNPVEDLTITVTVPWFHACPYAPIDSPLWTDRDPRRF